MIARHSDTAVFEASHAALLLRNTRSIRASLAVSQSTTLKRLCRQENMRLLGRVKAVLGSKLCANAAFAKRPSSLHSEFEVRLRRRLSTSAVCNPNDSFRWRERRPRRPANGKLIEHAQRSGTPLWSRTHSSPSDDVSEEPQQMPP
jgi:hypothetical protein